VERIVLAAPRGFCAGVAYAIEVVDLALKAYGTPLYVRHAIVHNEWVVKSFEHRGVIFVEEINEIPSGSTVVFSAHGVSPAVRDEAASRQLRIVDATCPLVTKVHNEAKRYADRGYFIVYIAHRGHVEAVGTMGEASNCIVLVENPDEAERVEVPPRAPLALLTQTTLSVGEVERTVEVLRRRFPHIEQPTKEDICYATTNRQNAIRELTTVCDLILIVGSPTSSNSNRLREVAESLGVESHLVPTPGSIPDNWRSFRSIGVSSGASTPESVVQDVINRLLEGHPKVPIETLRTVEENIHFRPPHALLEASEVAKS